MEVQNENGTSKRNKPKSGGKRQLEIKGAERKTDKELDRCVEKILEHNERRILAKAAEDEERENARALMSKKGLRSYTYFDGEERYTVTYQEREAKVSVKKAKNVEAEAA